MKRALLWTALAAAVVGLPIGSQVAGASHVRPKGATPLKASFVPAYKQCASPNSLHGEPLAFGSCSPPVQSSNFLTVGTGDANGASANLVGYILLTVKATHPEDILITSSISDVRCRAGTDASVCSSANAVDGPDYSGQLQSNATIRLSDHYNGQNHNEAATVVDVPFPVNFQCANTSDTSIGGLCTVNTTELAQIPPYSFDGLRSVVQIGQLEVRDGGPDGYVPTEDNTVFLRQGIFVP